MILVLMDEDEPTLHSVKWQAILIRPEAVLSLIRSANGRFQSKIPTFPPDVRLVESGWDERRGSFVLVIESDFFQECTAMSNAIGRVDGTWPEFILDIAESTGDEDLTHVPLERMPDIGTPSEPVPWEAYAFDTSMLLELITLEPGARIVTNVNLPPDGRLVWGFHDAAREKFGFVLSSMFNRIVHPQLMAGEIRIPIVERALEFTVVSH